MNCAIVNGHLGLSSHHGVHGNNNTRLLIENVTMSDYEVAGIHLNGASDTVIRNVSLNGHRTDIPTRATYSGARFLLKTLDPLILSVNGKPPLLNASAPAHADLLAKRNVLKALMDEVLAGVRAGTFPPAHGTSAANASEAYSQFGMVPTGSDQKRVVDGGVYGISLSSAGIIVSEFKKSRATASPHGRRSLS